MAFLYTYGLNDRLSQTSFTIIQEWGVARERTDEKTEREVIAGEAG